LNYLGDFASQANVICYFNTHKSDGTPITLAGTPAISVYKDDGTTETTTGPTLTVDFDSRTGAHCAKIVTTDGFYSSGHDYKIMITSGTVDGVSVVGTVVGEFSIENRSALRPTAAGRTLDVASTGEAGLDFSNRLDTTGILPNNAAGASGGVAIVGSKMDIADSPSSTGVAVIVSAMWDKLTSGIITSGSIGKLIKDYLDATISSRSTYAGGAVASVTAAVTLATDQAVNCTKWNSHAVLEVVNGSPVVTLGATQAAYAPAKAGDAMALTAAAIDAAWDEILSGHVGAGSVGKAITDILAFGAPPTGAAIADIICDEVISTGHSVANSLGKIIYDNVNAPIATVDTVVDAIKAKTDNLPASPAAVGSKMDIADSPSSTGVAVIVSAIWDKLTSGITTSGSIGKLIKDYLDAAVTTRAAASTALSTSVWTSGRAALLDFLDALVSSRLATSGYTTPHTKDQIADQVWDEQMSGHTATGSAGKTLSSASAPSVSEIDAQLSGNHGAGAWGASAVGTIAYPDPEVPFLDENGDPMVGVKVEAFSNSARTALVDVQTTDVNGNFQFHLNAGEYWFRASLLQHVSYEWAEELGGVE
jgi:hypothetical protein